MTLVTVTFEWDDRHGECYDCGRPAAYVVFNQQGIRVCGVDAAWRAANGDTIREIDPES